MNSTVTLIATTELPTLNGYFITGLILIFFMNIVANAGGLGDGGIMIPIMTIFLELNIDECIPLANSFALISSITRFVKNYQ